MKVILFCVFFGRNLFWPHRNIHIFLKTGTFIQGIGRITLLRPLRSPRYPERPETYEGGFTLGIRKISVRSQVSEVDGLAAPRRDLPESRTIRDDDVQKERTACLSKFRPPSRNMIRKPYRESTALSLSLLFLSDTDLWITYYV